MHSQSSSLLNDAKLARRLGVRAAWLRAEADAGQLPHVKAGDRYLFDPVTVERLLLGRARAPKGEPETLPPEESEEQASTDELKP